MCKVSISRRAICHDLSQCVVGVVNVVVVQVAGRYTGDRIYWCPDRLCSDSVHKQDSGLGGKRTQIVDSNLAFANS